MHPPSRPNPSLPSTTVFRYHRKAGILLGIVAAGLIFNLYLLPSEAISYPSLKMNPEIFASVTKALSSGWYKLLLPYEYETGRFYWCPSIIFFVYWGESLLGGVGNFALFYALFIATAFGCAFFVTRSCSFAGLTAFLFAFGTQNDYVFTYGNLIALYILLTYVAINLTGLIHYLRNNSSNAKILTFFAASLVITAVSNEMWLNYATGLICALAFALVWAHHHGEAALARRMGAAFAIVVGVLALYLAVRLRVASQYVKPGAEEELIVTYRHWGLVVDDIFANFLTLLYESISNYLPSFLTGSNSIDSLSVQEILASQHNYHAEYQNLIVMNHLFLWRFHAGILVTLYLIGLGWAALRSWRSTDIFYLVVVTLGLMVIGSFSTHLSIKMRPYNIEPHLPYKVIISVSVWTVLLSYVVWWLGIHRSLRMRRLMFVGLCLVALDAGFTRPGTQRRTLAQTGLVGNADPLPKLNRLWHQLERGGW